MRGSRSEKTNSLIKLINQQPDIDMLKIHMKQNVSLLINKGESTGSKYFNDSKAFIEKSNGMDNIYKNLEEQNPKTKSKISNVFDDMMANMLTNKKLNLVLLKYVEIC